MKISDLNEFIQKTKQMNDDYNALCEEIDLLLHSLRIDNTELSVYLGLNRISIGRKRVSKYWKPEELLTIATFIKSKMNL